MPTIRFDEHNPKFNALDISGGELALADIFTLPHIKSIGSDQGCGCGYRYAIFEDKKWFDVVESEETPFDNGSHEHLADYILENNKGEEKIELIVFWNSDIYPIENTEKINLHHILDPDFHFKERVLYTVDIKLPLTASHSAMLADTKGFG